MIGAIIGDTVGSRFEFFNTNNKFFDFFHEDCSFTDDSVMTIAIAQAILEWDREGRPTYERLSELAIESMRIWGRAYPYAGYGGHFAQWLEDPSMGPYNSCGNGAAMRVSPVGWAARDMADCIAMSRAVTEVTHNHSDGIKGAEATAIQIFLARQGKNLKELKAYETQHYYPIAHDLSWYRKNYKWESLCDGTCQAAFECLYESTDFEDAIRNCMEIGGDCDTTGAICGSIAEAIYGVPTKIQDAVRGYLFDDQLSVLEEFREKYVTQFSKNHSNA